MVVLESDARRELISEVSNVSIEMLAAIYSMVLTSKSVCVQTDCDSDHYSGVYSYGTFVTEYRAEPEQEKYHGC